MPGRLFLVSMVMLTLAATPAVGGEIRGKVSLSGGGGPARAEANPYPGQLGSVPQKSTGGVRTQDLVIFIDGADGAPSSPRQNYQMAQQGQAFVPRVLAVPVGAEVHFPNGDPVFHNVFSYSRTKKFDLGRYGKGRSKTVRFDNAGLVKVFCEIHSSMSGFIYVVDGAILTQPDEHGDFTLRNVPVGTHELVIWHPDRGERRMSVDVEQDKPLELELSL